MPSDSSTSATLIRTEMQVAIDIKCTLGSPPTYPPSSGQPHPTARAFGQMIIWHSSVFGGTRPYDQPLRILVAGCGTGDAVTYLATQLALWSPRSTLVGLDLSSSSLSIVRDRLEALSRCDPLPGRCLSQCVPLSLSQCVLVVMGSMELKTSRSLMLIL